MTEFIVATHSTLAEGFGDAFHFFVANANNLHVLDAYVNGDTAFEKRLTKLANQLTPNDIIVFTDLPGGSVNRIACEHIEEFGYRVISGINLPLILELALSSGPITDEMIRSAIENARNQLVYMNTALAEEGDEEL